MTKKHFIALADLMITTRPNFGHTCCDNAEALQWVKIKDGLADFCQSQNPRFNREHWLGYIAGENGPSGKKK